MDDDTWMASSTPDDVMTYSYAMDDDVWMSYCNSDPKEESESPDSGDAFIYSSAKEVVQKSPQLATGDPAFGQAPSLGCKE